MDRQLGRGEDQQFYSIMYTSESRIIPVNENLTLTVQMGWHPIYNPQVIWQSLLLNPVFTKNHTSAEKQGCSKVFCHWLGEDKNKVLCHATETYLSFVLTLRSTFYLIKFSNKILCWIRFEVISIHFGTGVGVMEK